MNDQTTAQTPSRRKLMRRLAIGTLIGGLAAGVGFKAFAQGGPCGGRHAGFMGAAMDPAMMDERIERMAKHFAVEAEATPEQTQKLADIAKAAARDLRPLRDQRRELRSRAKDILSAPTVDRAAIEKLRVEQMQLADTGSKRIAQAIADSAEVLTPAQRAKVAERLGQWGEGRGWGRRHG